MKEVLLMGGILVMFFIITRIKNALPATPTTSASGKRWYQIKSTRIMTAVSWCVGIALLVLLASKFGGEKTDGAIQWCKENPWITGLGVAFIALALIRRAKNEKTSVAKPHGDRHGASSGGVGLISGGLIISLTLLLGSCAYSVFNDTKRREEIVRAEIAAIEQGQRAVKDRHMQTMITLAPGQTSEPILIGGGSSDSRTQAADWWPKIEIPEIKVLEIIPMAKNGGVIRQTNSYAYTPRGTPSRNIDRYIAFRNDSTNATFSIEFVRGTSKW